TTAPTDAASRAEIGRGCGKRAGQMGWGKWATHSRWNSISRATRLRVRDEPPRQWQCHSGKRGTGDRDGVLKSTATNTASASVTGIVSAPRSTITSIRIVTEVRPNL